MNPKHEQFALARAHGVPAREAAISVGYATAGAAVTASRLEAREDVQKAIRKFRKGGDSAVSDTKTPAKSFLKPRYDSSLDLLKDLYNNPNAPDSVRIESAKLALPYEHGRIAEAGKKQKEKEHAVQQSRGGGKFQTKTGPGRPPSRMN